MKINSHPKRFMSQKEVMLLTIVIVAVLLGFVVFVLGSLYANPSEMVTYLTYAGAVMVTFVAFLLALEGVRWWWKRHKGKKPELR